VRPEQELPLQEKPHKLAVAAFVALMVAVAASLVGLLGWLAKRVVLGGSL
jgi:hypothetical protein